MRWYSIWIQDAIRDLRHGLRSVRKALLPTAVAVISIALGIGANAAVFTLLDAVALRPLPIFHPDQVVILSWRAMKGAGAPSGAGGSVRIDSAGVAVETRGSSFPFPVYEEISRYSKTLVGSFAYCDLGRINLVADGVAGVSMGEAVSGSYHEVLGVSSSIGRTLLRDDDREGAPPTAIISYRLWQDRFSGDVGVIGKNITINGAPFRIVGVEARRFAGLENGSPREIFIPLRHVQEVLRDTAKAQQSPFTSRGLWWVQIGGRLVPGIPIKRARAEIDGIVEATAEAGAGTIPRVEMTAGEEWENPIRELLGRPLLVLMALAGAVLLITCANVASVLLSRAAAREKETAVMLALGATRSRLVRRSLAEGLLLSSVGAFAGLWISGPISAAMAKFYDYPFDVHPDQAILTFTAAVTLLTGILMGSAPAFAAVRTDPHRDLQSGSRTSLTARVWLVGQFAIALAILVSAGLYIRTLVNLRRVGLGIDSEHLLVFYVEPALAGYTSDDAIELYQRFLSRIKHVPSVRAATVSWHVPLTQSAVLTAAIHVDGMLPPRNILDWVNRSVFFNAVGPGYFATVGTPILRGRGIDTRDRAGSPRVAVIDEAFAKAFFPNQSPIGRRVQAATKDYVIVGVARQSKYAGIRKPDKPTLFAAFLQQPEIRSLGFEIRTGADPKAATAFIQRIAAEIDPRLPLLDMATERELVDRDLRQERLFTRISGAFAVLVLLLASTGIYGTRAHAVARRTQEFGIRMALGATPRKIVALVIAESVWLAAAGIAIGLVATIVTAPIINAMLFGVTARDWPTFCAAAAVLLLAACLAGLFPALRAARIDPALAVRQE